jgi:hypothetical protein
LGEIITFAIKNSFFIYGRVKKCCDFFSASEKMPISCDFFSAAKKSHQKMPRYMKKAKNQ